MATLGHFIKDFTEKILTRSNLRIFQIIERVRMFQRIAKHDRASSNCERLSISVGKKKANAVDHTLYLLFEQPKEFPREF